MKQRGQKSVKNRHRPFFTSAGVEFVPPEYYCELSSTWKIRSNTIHEVLAIYNKRTVHTFDSLRRWQNEREILGDAEYYTECFVIFSILTKRSLLCQSNVLSVCSSVCDYIILESCEWGVFKAGNSRAICYVYWWIQLPDMWWKMCRFVFAVGCNLWCWRI